MPGFFRAFWIACCVPLILLFYCPVRAIAEPTRFISEGLPRATNAAPVNFQTLFAGWSCTSSLSKAASLILNSFLARLALPLVFQKLGAVFPYLA